MLNDSRHQDRTVTLANKNRKILGLNRYSAIHRETIRTGSCRLMIVLCKTRISNLELVSDFFLVSMHAYRTHIREPETFHIRGLQRNLGLSLRDQILQVYIFQRTSNRSIEAVIIQRQLRWIGHVIKMLSEG